MLVVERRKDGGCGRDWLERERQPLACVEHIVWSTTVLIHLTAPLSALSALSFPPGCSQLNESRLSGVLLSHSRTVMQSSIVGAGL